jgi:hypothetical protein
MAESVVEIIESIARISYVLNWDVQNQYESIHHQFIRCCAAVWNRMHESIAVHLDYSRRFFCIYFHLIDRLSEVKITVFLMKRTSTTIFDQNFVKNRISDFVILASSSFVAWNVISFECNRDIRASVTYSGISQDVPILITVHLDLYFTKTMSNNSMNRLLVVCSLYTASNRSK